MNIVWVGDLVVQSGFGRIGNEVTTKLVQRGHALMGVGIQFQGQPSGLPFHVWPTGPGVDLWALCAEVINNFSGPAGERADAVVCCQDYPYSVSLFRDARVDWGDIKRITITPIDGEPIFDEWVEISKLIDATMTISEFGVEALRKAGVQAGLCAPGVNPKEFYAPTESERAYVRGKAGIDPAAFIVGMAAMNQGRKNVPATMVAFKEFAMDKPEAKLLLDMDKISPAGWKLSRMNPTDARGLMQEIGLRDDQVIFGPDLKAALPELRQRYWLMDTHGVISYREGFGLPIVEGMACGVATFALDWCSGTEIVDEGRGLLIARAPELRYGTWGNAMDADPVTGDLVKKLNWFYKNKKARSAMAEKGREWAAARTWDKATDAVEATIAGVVKPEPTV